MTDIPYNFLNRTATVLEAVHRAMQNVEGGFPSCMNCEYFSEVTEGCRLAGGARPPARVIAFGCSKFLPAPPF